VNPKPPFFSNTPAYASIIAALLSMTGAFVTLSNGAKRSAHRRVNPKPPFFSTAPAYASIIAALLSMTGAVVTLSNGAKRSGH